MTTNRQLYNQAKKLGVCSMFSGKEKTSELMDLVFTPQGIEFCTKYHFPSLPVYRTYKGAEAEEHNIYIDREVSLNNVDRVLLVGDTQAVLTYDDPTKRHEVILMHGAKARIEASGWAVVFVTNAGGVVETEVRDNAKIL